MFKKNNTDTLILQKVFRQHKLPILSDKAGFGSYSFKTCTV